MRDPDRPIRRLHDAVLGELILLASTSDGRMNARLDDPGLAGELAAGLREHLCRQVDAALTAVDPQTYVPTIHPLEAWERWLALRAALDRLGQHDPAALLAVWNGRAAATVWNWTCAVFDRHPQRAGWVAHAMYQWLADQAEQVGDLRTAVVNRENARIALAV